MPKIHADGGSEQTSEGPGKAYGGASLASDAHGFPSNVSAKSREEDGHVGGEAAAADVDVMAELVNENEDGKTYAEFEAVERPVDREEREKTEKEFQFE